MKPPCLILETIYTFTLIYKYISKAGGFVRFSYIRNKSRLKCIDFNILRHYYCKYVYIEFPVMQMERVAKSKYPDPKTMFSFLDIELPHNLEEAYLREETDE